MINVSRVAITAAAIFSVTGAAFAATPMDDKQKLSYVLGNNTAHSLQSREIQIDPEAFLRGMTDALNNKPSAVTDAEIAEVQNKLRADLQARAEEKYNALSNANIEAGKKFIEQFAKNSDAKSLDSGVYYRVKNAGTGASPTPDQKVVVHYTGKLVNGQVFDSSVQRGEPAELGLTNVIQGWREVLPMMKVGSRWEVVIPPALAYGERGAGNTIGPNSTLVFDIELLEIK